jgi:transposase
MKIPASGTRTRSLLNLPVMNKNNTESIALKKSGNRELADRMLVAVDTHAAYHVVGRQIDSAAPQPTQRVLPQSFVAFALKQLTLAREVHVVYEAGPFGFTLARTLLAHGIKCLVVTPKKLDPYHKRVRTDKTDTRELLADLDRYVRGNTRALRVVRIPTVEEELLRARNRQRDALCRDSARVAARGRTLLLHFGYRVSNMWWKQQAWDRLSTTVPQDILHMLEQYRTVILELQKLIKPLEKTITADAPKALPVGMGKLTFALLLREVLTWDRFKTRRQVGGFTGLCGGVLQSGSTRQDLSITKAGHRRMRTLLIELAWRMLRYQPQCGLVKKWAPRLAACGKNKSRRKQIIVALARQLAVDIWKWQTGRTTPQALGWALGA